MVWGTGQIPVANLGSGTASATTFLNGAGAWVTPGGGGTVTNVSAGTVADAFSLSVANQTSTPAISLGWSTGLVPTANLASSGTASGTTFLAGSQAWKTAVTSVDIDLTAGSTGLDNILAKDSNFPITGSTAGGLKLIAQSANAVLVGPTSGSATYPTFRALVKQDIASLASGITAANTDVSYCVVGGSGTTANWSRTHRYTSMLSTPTTVGTGTVGGGTLSIDLTTGALVAVTLSGTTTLSFSNLATALWGTNQAITVAVYHTGTGTTNFINNVTGAGTVRWRGGSAPTAGTASDFYQFTILSPTGPCLASYNSW
jgi:hypothetical protein